MTNEKFSEWCIVEIMGHQRFAGLVTEQTMGGSSFVRVDVPESDGFPAFTKMFGAGSIYCITPVTEEIARMTAKGLQKTPMQVYDFPEEVRAKLRTPALPAPVDDEEEEFVGHYQDDE